MVLNKTIKKIFSITGWTLAAAGLVFLLVAAIKKKNNGVCAGIEIEMNEGGQYYFVTKQDVLQIVAAGSNNKVAGKPIDVFNLRSMEASLKKNVWIKNAELFFDNNNVLQVKILERHPVARIFTVAGNSFYIDSSLTSLPLDDRTVVKLPVFTGFPADGKWSNDDSLLAQQVKQLSMFIATDSFWNAQIAQIDITPKRTFQMVPTVGNHLIDFGDGDDYIQKFNNLLLFYKNVLSKVGFEKYSTISVQFNKQIVGVKRGSITKIDSLQALKNIRLLIEQSKQMANDTSLSTSVDKKMLVNTQQDSSLRGFDLLPPSDSVATATSAIQNNSKPVINPSSKNQVPISNKPLKGTNEKPVLPNSVIQKPKAVMNKTNG